MTMGGAVVVVDVKVDDELSEANECGGGSLGGGKLGIGGGGGALGLTRSSRTISFRLLLFNFKGMS